MELLDHSHVVVYLTLGLHSLSGSKDRDNRAVLKSNLLHIIIASLTLLSECLSFSIQPVMVVDDLPDERLRLLVLLVHDAHVNVDCF